MSYCLLWKKISLNFPVLKKKKKQTKQKTKTNEKKSTMYFKNF